MSVLELNWVLCVANSLTVLIPTAGPVPLATGQGPPSTLPTPDVVMAFAEASVKIPPIALSTPARVEIVGSVTDTPACADGVFDSVVIKLAALAE